MRDVLLYDETLTFSKLCAGWLLRYDERMQVKGFARDLCKAVEATNGESDAEDIAEVLSNNRIIPDGHVIDRKTKSAYLFEIEDTNPISAAKLRKLSQIWFYLDCVHWDMKVFIIDRYLTCWRALPLSDIYFSLAFPDPRKSKDNRRRTQGDINVDWEATHRLACKHPINSPVVR